MKKLSKIVLVLLVFFMTNNVYAKENVTFSKCVDGDTIKVLVNNEEKTVRFLAIDTPETKHPTKGEEPFGKEASNYTCDRVTNAKKIELEYDDNSDKEDKYNRLLAWVWVDGYLLQDELIKEGLAEVAYLYDNYKYTTQLQEHEEVAKVSKKGKWGDYIEEETNPLVYFVIAILIIIIICVPSLRKKTVNKIKKQTKKKINKEIYNLLNKQ